MTEAEHWQRFDENTYREPNSGCWLWLGTTNGRDYGSLTRGNKVRLAHRLSYERHKGAIPEGLQIDHLCRVPSCINPDHLEAVTSRENTLRGALPKILRERAANRTHCRRGHIRTPETSYRTKAGAITCLVCSGITNEVIRSQKAAKKGSRVQCPECQTFHNQRHDPSCQTRRRIAVPWPPR